MIRWLIEFFDSTEYVSREAVAQAVGRERVRREKWRGLTRGEQKVYDAILAREEKAKFLRRAK